MTRQVREKMGQIRRGLVNCDCGSRATHLDSHSSPECDRCRNINAKVVGWHHATQQALSRQLQEMEY